MLNRLALALAAVLAAAPAEAAFYSFTFTETAPFVGTGSGDARGAFQVDAGNIVIGIAGTTSLWGDITGLIGQGGYANNDNQLSPTDPFVTAGGISFETASRRLNLSFLGVHSLFTDPLGSDAHEDSNGRMTLAACTAESLTACVPAAVPEPMSAALLGAGLLGLGAARRRRGG